MDIPVYKITKNKALATNGEHVGVSRIANTKSPAIKVKGYGFENSKSLKFGDEPKMRIVAPVMIPDINIYRFDEDGEYFCTFDKQTVEELFVDFQDMKDQGKIKEVFNDEHNNAELAPSFILETWMVGKDPKADRAFSEFGIEVPTGTVMAVEQFRDKEYYNQVIAEEKTGFSIEGFLGLTLSEHIINKIIKNKSENMNKKKFTTQYLEDGTQIWVDADAKEAYTVDENMDKVPLFDGEHKLKNGETIVTVGGKITETKKDEVPKEEMKAAAPVETPATVAETKLAEAPVDVTVDEVAPKVEDVVKPQELNPEEVIKIVQPILDEMLKKIAELESKIETDAAEEVSIMNEVKHVAVKHSVAEGLDFFRKHL